MCQTRTICQALQVLDNYSGCFKSNCHNNHVSSKQKYCFMHFRCMIAKPKPSESGGKRCTGRLQKDPKGSIQIQLLWSWKFDWAHLAHLLELGLRYWDWEIDGCDWVSCACHSGPIARKEVYGHPLCKPLVCTYYTIFEFQQRFTLPEPNSHPWQ
jgi:hypothetical protein